MVEHRDAVRQLGRVMIGQQKPARGEPNMARFHQRLRDQQVGRGMRLPRSGMVLPDPAFAEAKFVRPAQGLQVPSVTFEEAALRRMRGHRKQAVLHRDLSADGLIAKNIRQSFRQRTTL